MRIIASLVINFKQKFVLHSLKRTSLTVASDSSGPDFLLLKHPDSTGFADYARPCLALFVLLNRFSTLNCLLSFNLSQLGMFLPSPSFLKKHIYLFLRERENRKQREREREREGEGAGERQKERERENPKQAPHCQHGTQCRT